jgi:prepilin-type N-terminal cleavage/methylation domain-containing protein
MRKITGFTLIELLIVIAIILILIAIALPNFLEAQIRAKVARVEADLRTVTIALETYYLDWGQYAPQSEDEFDFTAHGLAQLTTPLTYLAELPYDAFVGHQSQAQDGVPVYFEMASTSPNPFRAAAGFKPPKNIHAYALYSHGPNVTDDFDGEGSWPFGGVGPQCNSEGITTINYSPTNGTRSRGNIHNFGGEWKTGHWCLDNVEIAGDCFDCRRFY